MIIHLWREKSTGIAGVTTSIASPHVGRYGQMDEFLREYWKPEPITSHLKARFQNNRMNMSCWGLMEEGSIPTGWEYVGWQEV